MPSGQFSGPGAVSTFSVHITGGKPIAGCTGRARAIAGKSRTKQAAAVLDALE